CRSRSAFGFSAPSVCLAMQPFPLTRLRDARAFPTRDACVQHSCAFMAGRLRHFEVRSTESPRKQMTGLQYVRGLADRTLPLNTIARTLGYDVTEAEEGRVVVIITPTTDHL